MDSHQAVLLGTGHYRVRRWPLTRTYRHQRQTPLLSIAELVEQHDATLLQIPKWNDTCNRCCGRVGSA